MPRWARHVLPVLLSLPCQRAERARWLRRRRMQAVRPCRGLTTRPRGQHPQPLTAPNTAATARSSSARPRDAASGAANTPGCNATTSCPSATAARTRSATCKHCASPATDARPANSTDGTHAKARSATRRRYLERNGDPCASAVSTAGTARRRSACSIKSTVSTPVRGRPTIAGYACARAASCRSRERRA